MTEIIEAEHSRLGPSSAHRWMHCAGSVGLIGKLGLHEEESSEEAARGTVQHEMAAECLTSGAEMWEFANTERKHDKWTFEVNSEMVQNVEFCLEFVRRKLAQHEHKGAVLYSETRVRSELDKEAYGTADIRIEVPGDRIIIIDFKFGMVPVSPSDEQLKLYGYYSYECRSQMMKGKGEPQVIELWIAQPRLPREEDRLRRHITAPQELEDFFVKETLPAMQATRDPDAKLTMGAHCKFCPANTAGKCPAVHAEVASLPTNATPDTFTNEEIGRLKTLKPIIDRFFKGIDAEALARARDRQQKIPGWKLVHKLGDRVWKDTITQEVEMDGSTQTITATPEQILREKYGDKAFSVPSLKSPAQIEKLPGGKAFTARMAFKPDTGMTLANEDDNREPAVGLMDIAAAEKTREAMAAIDDI